MAVVAAASRTVRPTPVEPVNESMSTSGWRSSSAPTVEPRAGEHVDHAVGQAGLGGDLREQQRVSGVISAGLSTMVLPAAMAGRIFHAAICSG